MASSAKCLQLKVLQEAKVGYGKPRLEDLLDEAKIHKWKAGFVSRNADDLVGCSDAVREQDVSRRRHVVVAIWDSRRT